MLLSVATLATFAGCSSNTVVPVAQDAGQPPASVPGAMCSTDGITVCDQTPGSRNILSCVKGTYAVAGACPELEPCQDGLYNSEVACGPNLYAISGNLCPWEQVKACSLDLTKVELCTNGVWVDGIHCPPSSCANVENAGCVGTFCSNCGYSTGDLCSFSAGSVVCSTDLGALLECSNGRTVVYQACTGATKCVQVNQNGTTVLTCQ